MRRAQCPRCRGARTAKYFQGQDIVETACHRCDGRGTLDPLGTYLLTAGRALRRYRINRDVTVAALAAELGIEPGDVASMEEGAFAVPGIIKGYTRENRDKVEEAMERYANG